MADVLPELRLTSLSQFRRQQWSLLLPLGAVVGTGLLMLLGERDPGAGQVGGVAALIAVAAWFAWRDWRRMTDTGEPGMREGAALLEAGRFGEARTFYASRVPLLKNTPAAAAAALQSAGVAALREGDRAYARTCWEQVGASGWPAAFGHTADLGVRLPNALALLHAIEGRTDEARAAQRLALSRCPPRLHLPWRVTDVRILLAEGKFSEADALLAKIRAADPAPPASQRAATLALLAAWIAHRLGRELQEADISAARAAPGSRRWIADPEMAGWMEQQGLS